MIVSKVNSQNIIHTPFDLRITRNFNRMEIMWASGLSLRLFNHKKQSRSLSENCVYSNLAMWQVSMYLMFLC